MDTTAVAGQSPILAYPENKVKIAQRILQIISPSRSEGVIEY